MTNGNLWTNFVKDWATEKGTSYMEAIKDPTLSIAYKQRKKDTKREAKTSQYQALKADAMMARFQQAGGKVEWKE